MSDIEKVKKLKKLLELVLKTDSAIKETGGDLDKAVEILELKEFLKHQKTSRDAKEGVVAISGDNKNIYNRGKL